MSARGLTLLETMVALVILGVVVVSYLEVFGGALRVADDARTWSRAVAYAEDGMEQVKLAPPEAAAALSAPERLVGGFERWVETRQWAGGDGLVHVTIRVSLPGGARYALEQLVRSP